MSCGRKPHIAAVVKRRSGDCCKTRCVLLLEQLIFCPLRCPCCFCRRTHLVAINYPVIILLSLEPCQQCSRKNTYGHMHGCVHCFGKPIHVISTIEGPAILVRLHQTAIPPYCIFASNPCPLSRFWFLSFQGCGEPLQLLHVTPCAHLVS